MSCSICRRILRSSRPEVFYKKGDLWNFVKFTAKHLCWSLFFNKVAGAGLQLYLKIDSTTGVLLWILQISQKTFFIENLRVTASEDWKVLNEWKHEYEMIKPFKRQPHKIVKHTQTIRRQIAEELFERVWLFSEVGA